MLCCRTAKGAYSHLLDWLLLAALGCAVSLLPLQPDNNDTQTADTSGTIDAEAYSFYYLDALTVWQVY